MPKELIGLSTDCQFTVTVEFQESEDNDDNKPWRDVILVTSSDLQDVNLRQKIRFNVLRHYRLSFITFLVQLFNKRKFLNE